jgi:peptide-methionine (S)-S-oxide reductase
MLVKAPRACIQQAAGGVSSMLQSGARRMLSHRLAAASGAFALLAAQAAPAAAALKTAVFAGGTSSHPTYGDHEGYLESIQVAYDPAKISYPQLVDAFFHHIDPTDANGQICDRGPSYRTAVFAGSPDERAQAEAVKAKVAQALGKPVATRILHAATFWPAEAYHQDYARKNPVSYTAYRVGCGRDARLKAVWRSAG